MEQIFERMVALRIACDELDYPFCEAMYGSIEAYEKDTGENFWEPELQTQVEEEIEASYGQG